jgi:hypothetical protein
MQGAEDADLGQQADGVVAEPEQGGEAATGRWWGFGQTVRQQAEQGAGGVWQLGGVDGDA